MRVCVSACVRDCFERAWATPDFGYQTWLKHCFGKAWATPDIDADTCTPKLINDCFAKASATPDFAYQNCFYTRLREGLGHARHSLL